MVRQLNADRPPLVELDQDFHAFLEKLRLLADELLGKLDLVEGLDVHEDEGVAVLVEELKILLIEIDGLDAVAAAKALVELGAIHDVFEFDLIVRAALAGLHGLGFDGHPQLALMIDHGARADFVSADRGLFRSMRKSALLLPAHARGAQPAFRRAR